MSDVGVSVPLRTRRVVVVGQDTLAEALVATAIARDIPTERVPADDDPHVLVERLVETIGDGEDVVLVTSGDLAASASTAARRTGADLWLRTGHGPERYDVTPSAESVDDALEDLHRDRADPWGVESRWFERRKRDLVLAMLPRVLFERALELGCSTGALAEDLATRSIEVVAVDRSATAVAAASRRFEHMDHVSVRCLDVPREWPEERFDLVVVSEVGYFMTPPGLRALVTRVAESLAHTGVVLLCHWRHPIRGWVLDADAVAAAFEDERLPPVAARYRDVDVEVVVLARATDWPDPGQ